MPHDFLSFFVCDISQKIAVNFRKVSLREVLFSVSVLEFRQNNLKVPGGENRSLKNLYYKWTSSQVIFKFSSRIFFTYLSCHLFTEAFLFVSYIAHIFCICIYICKRYYFPLLLFLRWKPKENIAKICYLLALCFRRRQNETFRFLKCFYSNEQVHIRFRASLI